MEGSSSTAAPGSLPRPGSRDPAAAGHGPHLRPDPECYHRIHSISRPRARPWTPLLAALTAASTRVAMASPASASTREKDEQRPLAARVARSALRAGRACCLPASYLLRAAPPAAKSRSARSRSSPEIRATGKLRRVRIRPIPSSSVPPSIKFIAAVRSAAAANCPLPRSSPCVGRVTSARRASFASPEPLEPLHRSTPIA